MSSIVGVNGEPLMMEREVPAPPQHMAQSFFHRAALGAAAAVSESTPAKELGLLTEIATTAAMCRDLLTVRRKGKVSDNLVYEYMLQGAGPVTAAHAAAAVLWIADSHERAAEQFPSNSAEYEAATGRVASLRKMASFVDVEPDYEQRKMIALWVQLASRLTIKALEVGPARGGLQLFMMSSWFGNEAVELSMWDGRPSLLTLSRPPLTLS